MPSYTTTELIADIKRLAHVPTSNVTFLTADFLAFADEETHTSLMRQILSVRENYYLTYTDTAVNATGIYQIPPRAIGGKLAVVHNVVNNSLQRVWRVEVSELDTLLGSPGGVMSLTLQGNNVVITPIPSSGSVRLWHYRKPNALIATTAAGEITAINTGTNQVTVSSLPSTMIVGTSCDFIKDQPGFDWLDTDEAITAVSSNTLTFAALPSSLAVGDWVTLAGETPVPQIPVEFRPLLVRRVAEKILEAQGNTAKLEKVAAKRKEMEKDLFELINPRIQEQPKKIVAYNGVVGFGPYRRAFRP